MRCSKSTSRIALIAVTVSLIFFAPVHAKKPAKPGGGGGGGGAGGGLNYEVVPLDDFGGFFVESIANDINQRREVVGWVVTDEARTGVFTAFWQVTETGQGVQTHLSLLPDAGYEWSGADGINNLGEIVGSGSTGNTQVGLYWPQPDAEPITLPPLLGDNNTWPNKISADGVICGRSRHLQINGDGSSTLIRETAVVWQAFLSELGTPGVSDAVALPVPPDARRVNATAIGDTNDDGFARVVGYYDPTDDVRLAVSWTVAVTDQELLPFFGDVLDTSAAAYGVNNSGDACGKRWGTGVQKGAVWSGETTFTLNQAKFTYNPYGNDMNDAGLVVGNCIYQRHFDGPGSRAVVWPSVQADMVLLDKYIPVGSPFYHLSSADAVNEGGDIVGYGWTGETQGYVAIRR